MTATIVNLAGILTIIVIVWWFWLSVPKARKIKGKIVEILVENGTYAPPRIEVEAGTPVTLRFLRKDASPCAEKVVFEQLGISADLPIGTPTDITIELPEPGEFDFACQMQMYKGSIVAKRGES